MALALSKGTKNKSGGFTMSKTQSASKEEKKVTAPLPKLVKKETNRDEFGIKIGSMSNLFIEELKKAGKKGTTMNDIRSCEWNLLGAKYPGTLSKLRKAGRVETKEGRLFFK